MIINRNIPSWRNCNHKRDLQIMIDRYMDRYSHNYRYCIVLIIKNLLEWYKVQIITRALFQKTYFMGLFLALYKNNMRYTDSLIWIKFGKVIQFMRAGLLKNNCSQLTPRSSGCRWARMAVLLSLNCTDLQVGRNGHSLVPFKFYSEFRENKNKN